MFRLFLRKKLLTGKVRDAGDAGPRAAAASHRRNRRISERYSVDHKHLTLMNDQDILLVREISAKGFSTEVSTRGYERLTVGDVYDARVRYLGEIYSLQARVAWKHNNFVGFEIVKAGRETMIFIKRLLRPIEIGTSLKEVEVGLNKEQENGKQWLHGDESSDLYIWHDRETGELQAWQLAVGEEYVEWRGDTGVSTGSVLGLNGREALMGANLQGLTHQSDSRVDPKKKQLAIDVVMAMPHEVRDEILETLLAG